MFNSRTRLTVAALFALLPLVSIGSAHAAIALGVAQSFGVLDTNVVFASRQKYSFLG